MDEDNNYLILKSLEIYNVLNRSSRKNLRALLNILLWSVVAAAFVGPGTVTTAAKAGASFQYQLIWALVFSVFACWLLQEAAARIPLVSNENLGTAIAKRYEGKKGLVVRCFVVAAILMGGMAYQAGNILGAVQGLSLMLGLSPQLLSTVIVGMAALILWFGHDLGVSRIMGLIVAMMGISFIWIALSIQHPWLEVSKRALIPSIPEGADVLILGLIGTTIVPYNLFLGSGISKNQSVSQMRRGLGIAIAIGGFISIAILLVGTQLEDSFSLAALGTVMEDISGKFASVLYAFGLFAAGFTSSITAPLATSITFRSVWGLEQEQWSSGSRNYRLVWISVLLVGWAFGISGIKPVPVIILAQALNGLLLPFASILLLIIINDRRLIPEPYRNSVFHNMLMGGVVAITLIIGGTGLVKAWSAIF